MNQLRKLIGTMSGNEEFRYAGDANWYRFSAVSISVASFRCLGVSPAIWAMDIWYCKFAGFCHSMG
jgi:hypothetical protein